MQKMWIWYLGREVPLEEGMATHSSILAWEILWTEEPGGQRMRCLDGITDLMDMSLSPWGHKRVRHDHSD